MNGIAQNVTLSGMKGHSDRTTYLGRQQWDDIMKYNDAFRRAPDIACADGSLGKFYLGTKWVRR